MLCLHEEVSVVSVVLILWGVGQSINQSINQNLFMTKEIYQVLEGKKI